MFTIKRPAIVLGEITMTSQDKGKISEQFNRNGQKSWMALPLSRFRVTQYTFVMYVFMCIKSNSVYLQDTRNRIQVLCERMWNAFLVVTKWSHLWYRVGCWIFLLSSVANSRKKFFSHKTSFNKKYIFKCYCTKLNMNF